MHTAIKSTSNLGT